MTTTNESVPSVSVKGLALPDRTTLTAFLFFVLVSGGASVTIRFTYAELPPFFSGAMRFVFGALFFWVYAFIRKIEIPKGRALLGSVLFGGTSMGLSFAFIYWGLVKTPASLYQTIVALVPLLTFFFAALHRLESFRMQGLLGALLTVVGIIEAVGGAVGGDLSIPHVLAIIGGAA